MKIAKKMLPTDLMSSTFALVRTKFGRVLFGAIVCAIANVGFVSMAHAEEEMPHYILTALNSSSLGPGNIIPYNLPIDLDEPPITPPDFDNNPFTQQISPGVTVVPEPSTIGLAAVAAALLKLSTILRRRRS